MLFRISFWILILGFRFGLSYSMHVKYGQNSDVNGNSDGGKNEGHAVFMFKFKNDEVGCGSGNGKEVDVVWQTVSCSHITALTGK